MHYWSFTYFKVEKLELYFNEFMIIGYEWRTTRANKWRKQVIFNEKLIFIDFIFQVIWRKVEKSRI